MHWPGLRMHCIMTWATQTQIHSHHYIAFCFTIKSIVHNEYVRLTSYTEKLFSNLIQLKFNRRPVNKWTFVTTVSFSVFQLSYEIFHCLVPSFWRIYSSPIFADSILFQWILCTVSCVEFIVSHGVHDLLDCYSAPLHAGYLQFLLVRH